MKISMTEIEKMKQLSQRSILWDYWDEINAMRDENISFRVISDWLEKLGINTSVQNIRQFHERHKKSRKNPKQQLDSSSIDDGLFNDLI